MNTAKLMKGLAESVAADIEASRLRAVPVCVGGGDPTETLARLVMAWPPKDVRLDQRYKASHKVEDTSTTWVADVVAGVRVREERRVPGAGRLMVSLDFPCNMAEYERFNSVAQEHNALWEDAGSPVDSVDPWSGDVSDVEGYVDFARVAEDIPHMGRGGGSLDAARPSPARASRVTVEYRAVEDGEQWTLGFVARDTAGKALCWNEETGDDLAALVRRSVQMLYGNPNVVGDEGPLSDGLALLVQGRKAKLCEERNAKPSWLGGAVKRGVSVEYVGAKVEEAASVGAHTVLGCWVPIASILGMIVWAGFCVEQTWGEVPGSFAGMGWFLVGEVALCAVLWLSTAVSTAALRRAEAARMRSVYL